jgi:hypothetical protein
MEIKKTVKYDGKLKGVHIIEGKLVDDNGEIIDILDILTKAYGEKPFDLSTTTKTEEIIDIDDMEEEQEV